MLEPQRPKSAEDFTARSDDTLHLLMLSIVASKYAFDTFKLVKPISVFG
jgi:hypothetical protein